MVDMSDPQINYQEVKDHVEKLRNFMQSFFLVGDALAAIGPMNEVIAGKKSELAAMEVQKKDLEDELEAIRKTREDEGRDHDAKIAAARAEADRIAANAQADARKVADEAQAHYQDKVAQADRTVRAAMDEHEKVMEERRQALQDLESKIADADDHISVKRSEIQDMEREHSSVSDKLRQVREAAQKLLG